MKIFKILRSQEWWTYKLPPLLAIGYATSSFSSTSLFHISLQLIIILSSLVIGAIYVSVINDITDLEEDLASGKSNRIQGIPPKFRWLIPIICLLFGLFYEYLFYPDLLSCFLYLCSWIVFSLYSIEPFRFKNRGILGVFADACGSHVFTSLLMVSSVSYLTKQEINWWWFSSVGIWALCYGFRGILWHQFLDRENDIKVNLNTYASKVEPNHFINKSRLIFAIEVIALGSMLYQLNLPAPFIGLVCYFLLVLIRYKLYKSQVILILSNKKAIFQILMSDYYQMFFPLSILIFSITQNYFNIFILIIHIILFPYPVKAAVYDYLRLLFKRTNI
jgi:4-hydroxybenzoate polyprenyltransferase